MRGAKLSERIFVGQIGDPIHLVGRTIAGRRPDRFQRKGDDGIAGFFVGDDIYWGKERLGQLEIALTTS